MKQTLLNTAIFKLFKKHSFKLYFYSNLFSESKNIKITITHQKYDTFSRIEIAHILLEILSAKENDENWTK